MKTGRLKDKIEGKEGIRPRDQSNYNKSDKRYEEKKQTEVMHA